MSIQVTRDNFSSDEEYAEYQEQIREMAARQLAYNIKMLQNFRDNQPRETPCKLFYQLKKGIPLSVFLEVYPFNELVDCGSGFDLSELKELERLYSTFEESDQQFYIDSFQRLQQVINRILSNKVPGSYGKGFQSWKEQIAANQEIGEVLRNPEPSDREIDEIAYQNYMQTRIPSPAAPPVPSLFGRVKNLFGLGGGRKTSKKIYQKRSKSRSKKSNSHSKKSRSKSRYKK